jgi:membrane fusion protein, multidrug efflux system
MTWRRRFTCAALAMAAGACSGRGVQPPAPAVPVVVAAVARKDVPVRIEAIGSVEPTETVAIKPQAGGIITKVHFHEGMDVKRGDVLFTIDPRPYEAALHQAESSLERDEAAARDARANLERGESLFTQGILSKEQHDQLRFAAEGAGGNVKVDRAGVEKARLDLDYCTIRSPIDGRTGSLLLNEGNFVKAIDGGPLVVINRLDPVRVAFAIPERRLGEVREARTTRELTVEALVPGDEKQPVRGELTFVDNSADPATGTIRLKGTFRNGDRRLWPGLFVKVRLSLATHKNALVVPSQAIQEGQSGSLVFALRKDGTAEARPVVVGDEANGDTLIERGLEEGETVVTDGQLRLVPGAKVEVRKAAQEPAPGATP